MDQLVVCPNCKTRVLPRQNGTCPNCQAPIPLPAETKLEHPQGIAAAPGTSENKAAVPVVPESRPTPPPLPTERVKICPKCGKPNQPWREFCDSCFTSLLEVPVSFQSASAASTPPPGKPAPTQPPFPAQVKVAQGNQGAQKKETVAMPPIFQEETRLKKEYSEVLLEAAWPNLYRINSFRVMELPVDASPRELSKRQQIVEMAINTKLPVPAGSGRALPLSSSTDPNALRDALQRLRDPERRLVDEFFWFWPHQLNMSASDEALRALARGETEVASQIWNTQEREQSEANISVHNLAIMHHARALDLEDQTKNVNLSVEEQQQRDNDWTQAYKRWKILLDYENFWSRLTMRIRDLDDPRLTTGMARRMRASLPLTLLLINAQLAVVAAERGATTDVQRHRKLMDESGFGKEVIEEALHRAIGPTRDMIKNLCKTAQTDANADPVHADRVTKWLLEQAGGRLAILDCLLPANHPTRDSLHDDVAQQCLACQIQYGNKTEDWETSLELLKKTQTIAVSPTIKDRLEENIKVLQNNLVFDRCWFCQKRKGDAKLALSVTMHGEVRRIPAGYNRTRVEWKYRTLKVPRCPVCKRAHDKINLISGIGAGIGGIIGLAGCISISQGSSDAGCGGIIVLGIGVLIGYGLGALIGALQKPKSIRSTSAKNDFPTIKELKAKGWAFGQKPANVQ